MIEWLLVLGTLLLSGFFSGAEIAFVTANRLKLEILSRKNSFAGRALATFTKAPERFLSTTLVGNNIVNVAYATLITVLSHNAVENIIMLITGSDPESMTVLVTETLIASVIVMLFGEIIPKAIFRFHADSFAAYVAAPMMVINFIARPLIWLADFCSSLLSRPFGGDTKHEERVYRRQDIEAIFEEIHDQGTSDLDKEESEILTNVLELSNTRIKELMIPRTEIAGVEVHASMDDVIKAFVESGYSKMPVFEETIDNIIGVVVAHDLFQKPETLASITRPIRFVPAAQRAKNLLAEFRKANDSIAIVLDEYGGTAGIITIEDLLEEVVGDIRDEHDTDEFQMKQLSDGSVIVNAAVDVEDLVKRFPQISIDAESSDYETVGGYITFQLGRIPRANEEHVIRGCRFLISKATPARIETVKITPIPS
jgi:CBS domain containing-hemolysin-like protein